MCSARALILRPMITVQLRQIMKRITTCLQAQMRAGKARKLQLSHRQRSQSWWPDGSLTKWSITHCFLQTSMAIFSLEPLRLTPGPCGRASFSGGLHETRRGMLAHHANAIHFWNRMEIRLRWLVPKGSRRPLVGWHKLYLSHLHEAEVTVLAYPFKDAGFKYFILLNNMISALGEKRLSFRMGKRFVLPCLVTVDSYATLGLQMCFVCLLYFYYFLSTTKTFRSNCVSNIIAFKMKELNPPFFHYLPSAISCSAKNMIMLKQFHPLIVSIGQKAKKSK